MARQRPASLRFASRTCGAAARVGDAGLTCHAARRTLDTLCRAPEALAREIRSAEARRKPPRRVDERRALEALADLQAALAPAGIRPFLMFGTLLGAIRQQAFIPGDRDVDLAVLGAASLERMVPLVAGASFEVGRLDRQDGRPAKLKLRHRQGGELEIKAFEPEPDGAISWYANTGRAFAFRKRFPAGFGLRPIAFLGLTVHVPDCAEAFLEWHYGPGWRIPDPGYHMVTSGPIHGPEHREFCRLTGPRYIVDTLDSGRPAKALAMARGMARLFPDDALWPRLVSALEAALAEPLAPQALEDRAGARSA